MPRTCFQVAKVTCHEKSHDYVTASEGTTSLVDAHARNHSIMTIVDRMPATSHDKCAISRSCVRACALLMPCLLCTCLLHASQLAKRSMSHDHSTAGLYHEHGGRACTIRLARHCKACCASVDRGTCVHVFLFDKPPETIREPSSVTPAEHPLTCASPSTARRMRAASLLARRLAHLNRSFLVDAASLNGVVNAFCHIVEVSAKPIVC